MRLLYLTVFLSLLMSCTTDEVYVDPAQGLATGTWLGGLVPMNHPDQQTPLQYTVARASDDAPLTLTIQGPEGSPAMQARDLELDGDSLRFVFNEPEMNVPLSCALGRQDAGHFKGRCYASDGQWALFTMIPPAP